MTLPDGRTGRHFIIAGAVPKTDEMRMYGVNPKDGLNSAYPTVQLQGYWLPSDGSICKRSPTWVGAWRDAKDQYGFWAQYRARTALQVTLCKGGMIKGVTKLNFLMQGSKLITQRACAGTFAVSKLDSLFREALGYARFQLARLWKDVEEKGHSKSTSTHVCSNSKHWNGMECMNWMMKNKLPTTPGVCYLVDIKSVEYKSSWKGKKFFGGALSELRLVNDRTIVPMVPNFNQTAIKDCSNGRKLAGKCTVKASLLSPRLPPPCATNCPFASSCRCATISSLSELGE